LAEFKPSKIPLSTSFLPGFAGDKLIIIIDEFAKNPFVPFSSFRQKPESRVSYENRDPV
jgi:hypothetical protein